MGGSVLEKSCRIDLIADWLKTKQIHWKAHVHELIFSKVTLF